MSNWVKVTCHRCGKGFEIMRAAFKRRKSQSVSGNLYCSKECAAAVNRTERTKMQVLTKRERIALQILTAMIKNPDLHRTVRVLDNSLSYTAVKMADKLIAELRLKR